MKQTQLFGTTKKETPSGEVSKNAILLTRGGYIDKELAGIYTLLPLALRAVQKISAIVREEMNRLPHTSEVLMPMLQPHSLWEESGRREGIKEIMYDLKDEAIGLGPTHEEVAQDVFRHFVQSYKDLPRAFYQIQTKFRHEPRAKSGLLRGREFMMKDLYSFHLTAEDLIEYYDLVKQAYLKIYSRCGLNAIYTDASGGVFTKYRSHEFQVLAENGEDTIYLNQAGDRAWNKEVVQEDDPEFLQFCSGEIIKKNAIEVGNIFRYDNKYSKPMHSTVVNKNGEEIEVLGASYGIGITRLVGTIVEVYGDLEKSKMIWPASVAPFKIHLIELSEGLGEDIYNVLMLSNISDVLYDDRAVSAGNKFADADLIGSPIRIIVSAKTQATKCVEIVLPDGKTELIKEKDLINYLAKN
ncbi:MAG: aminoacyl--tRNA ligase-related protein [Patescibacteria group bacterium]|jgi:prolyl-tRNA synthetase